MRLRTIAAAFTTRAQAAAAERRLRSVDAIAPTTVDVADLAVYDDDGLRSAGILAAVVAEPEGDALAAFLREAGGRIIVDQVDHDGTTFLSRMPSQDAIDPPADH